MDCQPHSEPLDPAQAGRVELTFIGTATTLLADVDTEIVDVARGDSVVLESARARTTGSSG